MLLETILTHRKHTYRGFHPPFLGHKLRVEASWDFPLYAAIYSYLPQRTQAKDNVAHTKAKSLNRDYYESAIILPFPLHPDEWRV
jgi:hypothetical protein